MCWESGEDVKDKVVRIERERYLHCALLLRLHYRIKVELYEVSGDVIQRVQSEW